MPQTTVDGNEDVVKEQNFDFLLILKLNIQPFCEYLNK